MSSTLASITSSVTSAAASATTSAAKGHPERPPAYKAVGVSLAIASGVFIGVSYVLKKKGLLQANVKSGSKPGEGVGYLKNAWWWTGMILMIIGEICNFAAYAFVEAILVTPLGALSVVITAVLSSIFLKERLSFVGKIGCFVCMIGSIIIVIAAPEQSSAATIQEMKDFVIAPGFLSYAGVVILGCIFIVVWVGPRYGEKSMLVYLSVCSLIGGLSVVATQGLGAAVVTQASGEPQFNQWFLYVLFVFVVITLLTEIYYLNKALNIFNAALVTPTYYVFFTTSTIVTSAILFRGFKGSATSIATLCMGFLEICSGVVLLQLSKSAKDVPDTAVFRGDLDQVKIIAEGEEPESEPKADAIRGTAAIIRRISTVRKHAESRQQRQVHEDKLRDLNNQDQLNPNVVVEWDGLRRRVSFANQEHPKTGRVRRNTSASQHPGMGAQLTRLEEMEEGRISSDIMRIPTRTMEEDYVSSDDDDGHLSDSRSRTGRMRDMFVQKSRSQGDLRETEQVPLDELTLPKSVTGRTRDRSKRREKDSLPSPVSTPKKHTVSLIPSSPEHRPWLFGRRRGESSVEPPEIALTEKHEIPEDAHLRADSPFKGARRQFSFQGMFQRLTHGGSHQHEPVEQEDYLTTEQAQYHQQQQQPNLSVPQPQQQPHLGTSRHHSQDSLSKHSSLTRIQTEEERLGLVKGDASSYHDEQSPDSYGSLIDEKATGSPSRRASPDSPHIPSRKPVPSARNSQTNVPTLRDEKEWEARQ